MIWRPPRSTLDRSSAASDVYKRQKEEGYIFISPRNVLKEGRGIVTGKILSSEYKKPIEGAKITILDNYSCLLYTSPSPRD